MMKTKRNQGQNIMKNYQYIKCILYIDSYHLRVKFLENINSFSIYYRLIDCIFSIYNRSKSSLYAVSLDCQKAFDKVWRAGIFHKLIGKIDKFAWRAIISYYNKSMIVVKLNKLISTTYKTSEGCKQGGVLSSFLFNYFINGMLEECLDSNLGAKIGKTNLSIIALLVLLVY